MSLVADVQARIEPPAIDGLLGVEEVADLAALVKSGQTPQRSPWAYVVPFGFDGGAGDAVSGLFRQPYRPTVGVVTIVQALDDPKARKALATIDAIEQQYFSLICGWAPAGAIGVFYAVRGRLVSVANGLVIYEDQFALQNQLRIPT